MDSEKSINSFEIKMDRLPDYLLNNYFVYQFVKNFFALLCKINLFDFFDMADFFLIFVISRNIEILIESNYWLGMYVLSILFYQSLWMDRTYIPNNGFDSIKI